MHETPPATPLCLPVASRFSEATATAMGWTKATDLGTALADVKAGTSDAYYPANPATVTIHVHGADTPRCENQHHRNSHFIPI
jgi:hypothetical protein